MILKEEIKKIFRGEVEDDEATLTKYSYDASLLEVKPQLVAYPIDSEDVKNLVKWVSENKEKYPGLSITPRCAGTDMSGGAIGESIILDFTRHMNKLVGGPLPLRHKDEWEIAVQPGMYYRDFEKITLEKGLILPCYTASKSLNAVGGMYGNNSAGERTLKYGKTEDYIISARTVLADGNEYVVKPLSKPELEAKMKQTDFEGDLYRKIYKLITGNEDDIRHAKPNVKKNSAGYYIWNVITTVPEENFGAFALGDKRTGGPRRLKSSSETFVFDLNKLLVGSQGTLGIVTEITFKIIPDFTYSKLVAIFMSDLAPLGRLVDDILTLDPATLEAYDDKTLKLAVKFFPDFLKHKGLVGMMKFMWSFLPELLMVLKSPWKGLPKLVLLAEFTGENNEEVEEQCVKLAKKIEPFKLQVHVTKDNLEADKYWDIRRESFALLRKHVKGKRTAPFIDDIIVRPEFLPKFIPDLNKILQDYDLIYTLAGHAGDGNFHIIPLMDFSRLDTAKTILELSDKVYQLVLKYHGSITAEHNDGLIRTPYLEQMFGGKMARVFAQIKLTFDRKGIFNPGKKVPIKSGIGLPAQAGTKEYIAAHVAIEHKSVHKV